MKSPCRRRARRPRRGRSLKATRYPRRRACGRSSMAELQVSTLVTRVRFPPPALSSDVVTLFSEMKTAEREQARILRADRGMSIKEIARLLDVSTSSASLWVRDIDLTDEQHEALRQRNPIYNQQLAARAAFAAKRRAERSNHQVHGRLLARSGDSFHASGATSLPITPLGRKRSKASGSRSSSCRERALRSRRSTSTHEGVGERGRTCSPSERVA